MAGKGEVKRSTEIGKRVRMRHQAADAEVIHVERPKTPTPSPSRHREEESEQDHWKAGTRPEAEQPALLSLQIGDRQHAGRGRPAARCADAGNAEQRPSQKRLEV